MTYVIILIVFLLVDAALIVWFISANRVPDMSQYDLPEPELMVSSNEISESHQAVLAKLKAYHSGPRTTEIKVGRQKFAEMFSAFSQPADFQFNPVDVDGVPGEWVLAENSRPEHRLLYLHGGAFMVGSPETHRYVTTSLAQLTGCAVLAIDYRMMPEFTVIESHEDARTAYRWILDHGPFGDVDLERLFVAGESAGGALTLSTIAWARDEGLRVPEAAAAFAPATDASLTSPTWKTNAETDYFLGPGFGRVTKIPAPIRIFLSKRQMGREVTDPTLSPLRGELGGLPPTLIQVSAQEMLYGDAVRYTNRAREAGSEVVLQAWPELVHAFQLFGELDEASKALQLTADFLLAHAENTVRAA